MFNHSQLQLKDGKLNWDVVVELAKMVLNDETLVDHVRSLIAGCKDVAVAIDAKFPTK